MQITQPSYSNVNQITLPNTKSQLSHQDQSSVKVNSGQAEGISLQGATNLTYKIDASSISRISNEQSLLLEEIVTNSQSLTGSIENTEQYYRDNGQLKEVTAIIKIDGQVMAYMNKDGSYAGRNGVDDLFKQANGDINKLKQLIKEEYPSTASLETFEEGQEPTNAEVFELFNEQSYESFVSSQVSALKEALITEQMNIDEHLRRTLLFDQEPQTSVFTINGETVASMDEGGFVDIGASLLKLADDKNIDREQLAPLYTLDFEQTAEEYKATLTDIFGADVELENFNLANAPTRTEVRDLSSRT